MKKKAKKTTKKSVKTAKPTQYNHLKIEPKWQKFWEAKKMYRASDTSTAKRFYTLIEFPYPSGTGLHTGHVRSYAALDILARKRRAEGYNVLYPIGWDAFGLPAENYAIKTGVHPKITTKKNTDTFRRQLKALGISFDWSREINTTDPAYYKWTQWIFLQMFKKGLAYKKMTEVNWCPSCKVGLANEEVVAGACERCGTTAEKRQKEQWMLAITKYADRLSNDLDGVDYWDKIKIQQKNWIGKSEGMLFTAPVKGTNLTIQTFSAHFEAFAADTFVVIAPDHPRLKELVAGTPAEKEVLDFAAKIVQKRQAEGAVEEKEPEGIFTGRYIVDPVGNGDLPIWVASFALADYGTGIVKCSVHDERDFAFAKKYNIKLKPVLFPEDPEEKKKVENLEYCFSDMKNGVLAAPAEFAGKKGGESRQAIVEYLVKNNIATKETTFKLRDWVFSRQRYWGEPIPVIHCPTHGQVGVPEKDLPVKLPEIKKYVASSTGESPLALIDKWVNTKCPVCKGPAKRETDTMPQWAGSSWYFIRYIDPKNTKAFADPKKIKKWLPVNWYNGGMEHTTLHLLYSRFWYKFLFDQKLVPTNEPYNKRTSHGLILAEGGAKMSKSKGNVVSPDDIVKLYGADTLRLYEMFMGPFDQPVAWNTESMIGPRRFIERVWNLKNRITENKKTLSIEYKGLVSDLHKTIEKVSVDIEKLGFNTAVSAMMTLLNRFEKETSILKKDYEQFLLIVAPFAPHVSEEIWQTLGHKKSIHIEKWPKSNKKLIIEDKINIAIQVNGKLRATIEVDSLEESDVVTEAKNNENVKKYLEGFEVVKTIYVRGKIVNFVVKQG